MKRMDNIILVPTKTDYQAILGHIPQDGLEMRCQPSCPSCDCKCACACACLCRCYSDKEGPLIGRVI